MLGHALMGSMEVVGRSQTRYNTKALCTAIGIACERYRLKHNRWPEKLDDLAEFGISKGLTDPFDGNPLRYQRAENGIVIDSIGPDGIDNNGDVLGSSRPGDVGFRLWNAISRTVPMAPKPKFDDDEFDGK